LSQLTLSRFPPSSSLPCPFRAGRVVKQASKKKNVTRLGIADLGAELRRGPARLDAVWP
jgi:hypothetical protein